MSVFPRITQRNLCCHVSVNIFGEQSICGAIESPDGVVITTICDGSAQLNNSFSAQSTNSGILSFIPGSHSPFLVINIIEGLTL